MTISTAPARSRGPALRHVSLFLLAVLIGALVLAGCGGGEAGEGGMSGSVNVDGSSTVYPLTEAVAEEFMGEQPRVRVSVGVSGTGGGFARFLRGETDINDASRPITEAEKARAEENGIEYIELPVAYDGIAILVNPENTWAECLTVEELEALWEPGSEIQTWSDLRPDFPDRPIALYGPDTDSGTYDYFTGVIVGEEGASRADFTASANDNVLIQGITGDADALGYVGLAYYENNRDELKLLGVDDGDGCVQPSARTVNDGTYQPLARPEFIYVKADRAGDAAVEAFVEFYLEHAGELAEAVGYVSLSDEAYALAEQRFARGVTGSMYGEDTEVGTRVVELMRRAAPADTIAAPVPTDTSGT